MKYATISIHYDKRFEYFSDSSEKNWVVEVKVHCAKNPLFFRR